MSTWISVMDPPGQPKPPEGMAAKRLSAAKPQPNPIHGESGRKKAQKAQKRNQFFLRLLSLFAANPSCGPEAAHQPASSGKRFANFTLVRGAAIIGATASRQVA